MGQTVRQPGWGIFLLTVAGWFFCFVLFWVLHVWGLDWIQNTIVIIKFSCQFDTKLPGREGNTTGDLPPFEGPTIHTFPQNLPGREAGSLTVFKLQCHYVLSQWPGEASLLKLLLWDGSCINLCLLIKWL